MSGVKKEPETLASGTALKNPCGYPRLAIDRDIETTVLSLQRVLLTVSGEPEIAGGVEDQWITPDEERRRGVNLGDDQIRSRIGGERLQG